MKKFVSRLSQKREERTIRKTVIFIFLTIALILAIFYFGLPALIKLSAFLGNLKSSSQPPEKEDKIPPPPPIIFPLPEATTSAKINLSGLAEPGAKVEVFLEGISETKVVTDADGSFKISNLTISEGKNEIYALATDEAGNTSQPSEKLIVYLDTTPPKLEIFTPEDKTTFYGLPKTIEIKGQTDPDATVSVNDHLATMETEGKFSYSFTPTSGENKIKIVATDKAGNQTEKELTLTQE